MHTPLETAIENKHPPYEKCEAVREAERCLYCYDPPCVKACPTNIDIPTFIKKIGTDNVASAAKTILDANILGHSCAKVCPVEVLCAGACVYNHLHEPPIEIGRLQHYATSWAQQHLTAPQILRPKKLSGSAKVALIGAGPASIATAAMLACEAIKPTIFEKKTRAGGLNTYGVAPYKLKVSEAQQEIIWLASLGIDIRLGIEVGAHDIEGKMISFTSLQRNFDAVFIGVGLGEDNMLPIKGIDGPQVIGASDLIARIKTEPNLDLTAIKRAHIIGGGNTAMDIAHELKLLGVPEVTVLYRKSLDDMSAYAHELASVQKAGVFVRPHEQVREIIRKSDRLLGFITDRSNDLTLSDLVVMAIGQKSAAHHFMLPSIPFDTQGRIIVDPLTHRLVGQKIWAAGDCVNGGKEVVYAVAEAKLAVADMLTVLT